MSKMTQRRKLWMATNSSLDEETTGKSGAETLQNPNQRR